MHPQFWRIGVPKLCAWGRNPKLQSADMRNAQFWCSTALNLRSGRKNEIMRMISSFLKISKSGDGAASTVRKAQFVMARGELDGHT